MVIRGRCVRRAWAAPLRGEVGPSRFMGRRHLYDGACNNYEAEGAGGLTPVQLWAGQVRLITCGDGGIRPVRTSARWRHWTDNWGRSSPPIAGQRSPWRSPCIPRRGSLKTTGRGIPGMARTRAARTGGPVGPGDAPLRGGEPRSWGGGPAAGQSVRSRTIHVPYEKYKGT